MGVMRYGKEKDFYTVNHSIDTVDVFDIDWFVCEEKEDMAV